MLRTHNYNTYKSASDFLKSVVKRIKGEDTPEMNTTYLARQFNKKYNNWKEAKKNDKKYEGKTDIYNLDKRGYEELNLDVSMKMIFEITGERLGNSFVWVITMRNKFGKKMEEDPEIKGGLNDITNYLNDEPLSVTKTAQLERNKTFDSKNTIMDDFSVVTALQEAIYDFKEKIKAINPKSALQIANIRKYDVQKIDEERIDKLIKKVIKENLK